MNKKKLVEDMCEDYIARRKAIEGRKPLPERIKGTCFAQALHKCYDYQNKGIEARVGHGKYKGRGHAWAEYSEKGRWLIDDPAQKIKGWDIDDCGHLYEVSSYSYYDLKEDNG